MVASANVIVIAFQYDAWWSFNRKIRHNALGYCWLWLFRLAHIDYPYSISGFELDVFHIAGIFRNGNAMDRKHHQQCRHRAKAHYDLEWRYPHATSL